MIDVVVADERLDPRDRRWRAARASHARGIVQSVSRHRSSASSARAVELAARQHRDLVVGEQQEPPRHLVGGEPLGELRAELVDVHDATGRHADRRRDDLAAGVVVDADDVSGEPGDIADRRLDLARRDVRAAGLDHVAAASLEVEEAVVVDDDEVAGAVPAVGVEDLVSLAPVVALHQERAAQARARPARPDRRSQPVVGIDDPRLEAGRRPAERAAPVLGLVGLVVAHEAHAAGLGHAEHRVAQLRVAGRTSSGMIG